MAWYNASWTKRRLLTINRTQVVAGGVYTDFPVLVSLSGLSGILADGADIRFTAADGVTELPREIESYAGGVLVAWVKVTLTKTASDSTDDQIYMYYGNAAATEPAADSEFGSQAVWDANYVGVWHMKDATTSTITDSTANVNNGTKKGANEPLQAAGQIGMGQSFDGTDDSISIPDHNSLDITNFYTISAWINPQRYSGGTQTEGFVVAKGIYPKYNYRLTLRGLLGAGKFSTAAYINGGFADLVTLNDYNTGQYYYVVATYDGAQIKIYINGILENSVNKTGLVGANNNAIYFGRYQHNTAWMYQGLSDELRLSNNARLLPWIATEYANQSAPATFLAAGDEELMSGIVIPSRIIVGSPFGGGFLR